MSWTLEGPIQVGGVACCAIVECKVGVAPGTARVSGYGRKTPVMILMSWDGIISAMDLDGHPVQLSAVEERFPGLLDLMDGRSAN